jgi:NitT/TauT family transport system substrate-binding protein
VKRICGIFGMLMIMLATFAAGTAIAAPGPDKVTLRLDWTTLGYHAPFFLGVARGFYADAGLDVAVLEGKGSSTVINLVGNGRVLLRWHVSQRADAGAGQ